MFKTYNASAGSGKTTNLVAEYLSICLQSPERYRSVLAVTFTNNATAEMKERIIKTLNDFAFTDTTVWDCWDEQTDLVQEQLSRTHFIHKTTQTFTQLDSQTIRDRSEKLLENLLAHYPDFAISTIDSFFQRIIRSFAFDLGLNIDFNIEVSLDDYFQQTIDLLYQRLSNKNEKGKLLAQHVIDKVEQKMEETGKWRIDSDLYDILEKAYLDEIAPDNIALLKNTDLKQAVQTLNDTWEKSKKKFSELIKKGKKLLHDSGIPQTDFPQYGILDWFNSASISELKEYKATEKAINGDSFTKKGKQDLSPSERQTIIEIKAEIEKIHKETFYPCQLLFKQMKQLLLLFDLQEIIEELRLQDNKFFLSEAGQLIKQEVKENPVPYIYSKVGTRFSNYFIDEFQDTSDIQWGNMLPLLDEAIAGNDSEGKAILFGDVKQAIYRFRNGNPQLFADLVKTGTEQRGHFEKLTRCDCTPLDTNHRTYQQIIRFNNAFFTQLPNLDSFPERLATQTGRDLYKDFYGSVEQKVAKKDDGFVSIHFCPDEKKKKKEVVDYFVQSTIKAINDARNRNFRLRDIAVLCRVKKIGTQVGKTLADMGIPVISADSLVLGSNDNVNLIITLMRYIAIPTDALNRFYLVHLLLKRENRSHTLANLIEDIANDPPFLSPITKKMTDEEKKKTIAQNKENEKKAIQQNLLNFNQLLKREFNITVEQEKWSNLPLLTLTQTLMKELKLQQADSYLIGFIDLVNDYSQKQGNMLNSFLKWWDKKGAKKVVTSPEDIDAIRIMTIHKSKGKEFPVVIMPIPNKKMSPLTTPNKWQSIEQDKFGLPILLIQKNEKNDLIFGNDDYVKECALTALDETNILYVSQTRPENALYIIADKKNTQKKAAPADRFCYSFILEEFIKKNENDFTEKDGWYWFGDTTLSYKKGNLGTSDQAKGTTTIPISNFSQEMLIPTTEETLNQEIGIAVHSYFENATHFPMTEEEADNWTFEEEQPYQDEIRKALKSLTRQPHLLPYFTDNLTVMKEVNILTEDGKRRRPDRVVQTDGKTIVIDFKTGKPSDEDRKKHLAQVQEYVELLQSLGYSNVQGEILYL